MRRTWFSSCADGRNAAPDAEPEGHHNVLEARMSRRTRIAVAVATAAGAAAVALPMTATTATAQRLPLQVWVTSDGQVCYSANPDGSNAHCTG